jgi:P-type E1-E2 ATPase
VAIGLAVRQPGSEATVTAITYAITVLMMYCPCTIGIAVRMVIAIVSGLAARRSVTSSSASSIVTAHKTTDVVFNKTGTLTMAQLAAVRSIYVADGPEQAEAFVIGVSHIIIMEGWKWNLWLARY